MQKIIYEIGDSEKDGTRLLYGFLLPNNVTRDEREITDTAFRWVEKIAAIKGFRADNPCQKIDFKVSAPKEQKVKVDLLRKSERKNIGEFSISGRREWEIKEIQLDEEINDKDVIELTAEKEYLGMWRQNCYRLSTVCFHFNKEIETDFGEREFRKEPELPGTLLFGDLHIHTNASLCSRDFSFGTLQENIDKALEKGLNFIHFADHSEHFLHFKDSLDRFYEKWGEYSEDPFIIIPGYEWASKTYGNYNIYFDAPPKREAFVHTWGQKGNSLEKLWNACRKSGTRFVTIPHHTYHPVIVLNTSYPVPEELQTAVEVCSVWGSSEKYDPTEEMVHPPLESPQHLNPGFYINDMLRRGMKLGFVGGTDAHPTWPGDAGLTGAYVQEFSLKGIFDAIVKRRTYATNGVKMKLNVSFNGYPMGHIFKVNQYSINIVFPLHIIVDVEGTNAIRKIELIANGSVIKEETYLDNSTKKHLEWELVRGTYELTDTMRYYYIRVSQEKGSKWWPKKGLAWSSPVWIDYYFNDNPMGDVREENREFIDLYDYQMVPFDEPHKTLDAPKRKSLMDL